MQKATREPQRPKRRVRVAGGVALAESQQRPVLRSYEDIFPYALSKRAGKVLPGKRRLNPAEINDVD